MKKVVEVTELMTGNDMLPDVCTYNTMVRGLCDEGKIDEAVRLRDEMESLRLVPDGVTYNTLIIGNKSNRPNKTFLVQAKHFCFEHQQ